MTCLVLLFYLRVQVIAALLVQVANLSYLDQITLTAQLALVFTGGGFTGTIDPNNIDVQSLIEKAQNTVPILIAQCLTTGPAPAPAICFSGNSHVQVQSLEGAVVHKRMDALKIGDQVLSGDQSYSTVYSFGKKLADDVASYIQIRTVSASPSSNKGNKSPIEISQEHMLRVTSSNGMSSVLVPARQVKVGDFLMSHDGSPRLVESIRTVQRRGVYSPLTTKGDIVVDGIVASNYVFPSWLPDNVSGQILHWLQHGEWTPYRVYCSVVDCQEETYDDATGLSAWSMFLHHVEHLLLSSHILVQATAAMMLALPAVIAVVVGMLLTTPVNSTTITTLLTCAFGYYIIWKRAQNRSNADRAFYGLSNHNPKKVVE